MKLESCFPFLHIHQGPCYVNTECNMNKTACICISFRENQAINLLLLTAGEHDSADAKTTKQCKGEVEEEVLNPIIKYN